MALTTGDITIQGGTIRINEGTLSLTDFMEVFELGTLKYINEINKTEDDVTSLIFKREELQFTVADTSTTGLSVYDRLSAGSNPTFHVIYTDPASTSYDFEFFLPASNVSYNERERSTTLTLLPVNITDFTIEDYFDGGTSPTPDASDVKDFEIAASTFIDSVLAGVFIEDVINTFNSSFTRLLESQNYDTNLSDGNEQLYITRNTNASSASALRELDRLVALEGAIYGTGFGRNYFVDRKSVANKVTFSYGDFELLELQEERRLYQSLSLEINQKSGTNLTDTTESRTYSSLGRKTLTFLGIPETLQSGVYSAGDDDVDGIGVSPGTEESLVLGDGVDGYEKALGAEADTIRIKFTIFGVDSLKPFEPFDIDSTAPSRFQGNTYRPSTIEYDWMANKIKGEAYQIA